MHSPIITEAIQTIKKRTKSKPIKRGFSVIVKITKVMRLATHGIFVMQPFARTLSNSKIY